MRMTQRQSNLVFLGLLLRSLLAAMRVSAAEPTDGAVPPAWIKPVFDRGLTKIEFYDPAKQPQKLPGWTTYNFDLDHRFTYEYDSRETTRNSKKKSLVTITPHFTKVEFAVRHLIQLPKRLDTARVWDVPLAQHELEHVAISGHLRVVLLAEHLVQKIKKIERTFDNPSQITDELLQAAINDTITPRRQALDALLTANNRHLDKLTGHGAKALADREAYFSQLYLKENLDEMKFPFLSDVLDLLDQPGYQAARWESPTTTPE